MVKHAPWALSLALLATLIAVVGFTATDTDANSRGPLDVVGAFVYHIDRGNFGKACSLYAEDARPPSIEVCSESFVGSAAEGMMFGVDVFDNARIVAGSRVDNEDGSVTFGIQTDQISSASVTVAEQDSGRWKIVKIG